MRNIAILASLAAVVLFVAAGPGASSEPNRLDISRYKETFSDDFRGGLDVSPRGPATRWVAHTPWNGDFGDARFADPQPGFPFTTGRAGLRIEARKGRDGKWEAGLISGDDGKGRGFLQARGYFEMRARLPAGPGVWPAFWLISDTGDKVKSEVDVMEYYGHKRDGYEATLHLWPRDQKAGGALHRTMRVGVPADSLTAGYHTYGVSIDRDWIVFYLDRVEVARSIGRPEFERPMYMLVNLALGPGFPIDQTPNPSYLDVDYVKAFARDPSGR